MFCLYRPSTKNSPKQKNVSRNAQDTASTEVSHHSNAAECESSPFPSALLTFLLPASHGNGLRDDAANVGSFRQKWTRQI